MGHEMVADREPVLQALFGPGFRNATATAAYERAIYESNENGNIEDELIVIGKMLAYDAVELRRLATKQNLFGRFGEVRAVPCLMLWNQCERWLEMLYKLLILLDVPDEALITLGSTEQWWVKDFKSAQKRD